MKRMEHMQAERAASEGLAKAGGRVHPGRDPRVLGVAVLALALPLAAQATPVVSPGGKPGAATAWSGSGAAVTLSLAAGYDAAEVAEQIKKGVPGAQAKAEGDKVVVTGLEQAKLLLALEKVEVSASQDDVDSMLSKMQNPGGEEEGSGSSIRATKAADFSEVMGKKEEQVTGKVVEVSRADFPVVFVTVKLTQVPRSLSLPGIKAGTKIKLVPRVKSKGGVVDPSDARSKLNVGAWYAQVGDTVVLRLEPEKKDNVWVAAAFDRVK